MHRAIFLCLPFLFAFLTTCANSAGRSESNAVPAGETIRISLRDYRNGTYFAMVSGDENTRVDYYSATREDAATKVQSHEVMNAMVQVFRDEGLEKISVAGMAPAAEGNGTKALEIRLGERAMHVIRRPTMTEQEAKAFESYVQAFLAVYQQTYALQTVEGNDQQFRFEPVKSKKD